MTDQWPDNVDTSRFGAWRGTPKRARGPITADPSPFTASYGPHLCAACYGVGWMRDTRDDMIGQLVKCAACGTVDAAALNRTLAQCWQFADMSLNSATVPTIEGFAQDSRERQAMVKAAATYTREPRGWLTLVGPNGGGKTHIAECIARYLLSQRCPCLFMKSTHLWEYLGAVERLNDDSTDYSGRRRWVAELPALVIDDLGREKETATVARIRFELLDARYTSAMRGYGGATVITTNTHPEFWTDTALGSRAQESRFAVVECSKVDYRRSGK